MSSDVDALYAYAPLYGAAFDSDEVGWVGGRVQAFVPDRRVFALLEDPDVGRERAMAHLGWGSPRGPYDPEGVLGAPPPLCLVVGEGIPDNRRARAKISATIGPMLAELADAVLALRLLRPGWFLDPEHSMRALRYEPWIHTWRYAGAYRQAGLSEAVTSSMAAYELRLADLVVEGGDAKPVTGLFELVRHYRVHGRGAADIAIRNFTRSYGYTLTGPARAVLLFTALDAMLGGLSARSIGPYRLQSTFAERLGVALALDEVDIADAAVEVAWLDDEGRRMRNVLAHGRPGEVADMAERSHERVRAIVRRVLGLYLEFCIAWGTAPDDPDGPPSPAAGFSAALEAHRGAPSWR